MFRNRILSWLCAGLLLLVFPTSSLSYFALPLPAARAEQGAESKAPDCAESQVRGKKDASETHSSTGWFFGGLGSGILLGLIGTGIITVVAATSKPKPETLPAEVNPDCYRDGYRDKGKSKNTWSALGGGLVGTVVFVVVYVAVSDE
jgi:hypothetical protein